MSTPPFAPGSAPPALPAGPPAVSSAGAGDGRSSARHRRTGPTVKAQLFTALLVLITLVAGTFVIRHKPDQAHMQRPFFRPGAPGTRISVRTFDVTVLDTNGAVKLQGGKGVLDTTGIWVAVRARIVATEEPILLAYARLRDDRRRVFYATERVDQPLASGRMFQPGVVVEGLIVFEVAKDVRELTLLLSSTSDAPGFLVDAVAEVPLPVTVDAWLQQQKPVEVPRAKVVA